MIDVNKEKNGNRGGFVCSSPGPDPYGSQDLYNPVYEELCNGNYQLQKQSIQENKKKLSIESLLHL